MRVRTVLVCLVAVLVAVVSPRASERAFPDGRQTKRQPAPAQTDRPPAPAFIVNRIPDGRAVSLSSFRGKVVLLFFFFPT